MMMMTDDDGGDDDGIVEASVDIDTSMAWQESKGNEHTTAALAMAI